VKLEKLAIIGAGGWGTALAVLWANVAPKVILWGNTAARVEQMRAGRENRTYLPGIQLPESLEVTTSLEDCAQADLIVLVVPSTALRTIARRLRDRIVLSAQAIFVTCTKGVEHRSGMRMSEIIAEAFEDWPIAVLSGPNLAPEVSRGLPTASVLACSRPEYARELQRALGSPRFRIYTSDDLRGVELGGAFKNVFAIAAGASEGLDLGDNSKAALVTRALAEMIRLGTAMGGQLNTFYGLSGAGDLVLTCYSKQSRNRRVGERLGRGESPQRIASTMQMVAEGVPTAKSAYECARKLNVDTPIIDQVYALLYENKPATQALEELLGREQKPERV
jgi:glycerol-3-phosphate dehydrogenase (NAD(P)+)